MDGEIDADELRSQLEEGDVRVVDIRSPGAFERGHIPGSENVPFPSLVDEVERFEGDEQVVTVCPHGKSSVQAARLIASYKGFDGDVVSLAPGLDGWEGPLERGDASEATPADAATADGDSDDGSAAPF
ncbi:rhodanese-like domain-containing protein [Haloarcula mannanilytica]|uniref:Rhodanese-like domain-containing protein n=1 Tax=Haloarcula mannanilytica TaxID=2509225 RepID=A0A4C2EI36_9EURY|nr:rhodanese-like domain-containing protein [Haloarcula mannanilytica]GCF14178.1 rhodanese-like domain-containing protein [Haloarcula mannanilytica]